MAGTRGEWWYELDAEDRLVAVCRQWDSFARENAPADAVAATVLGRPLWNFVAGFPAEPLLRRLVRDARAAAGPVEAPFRCEASALERHMLLRADVLDGGRIRITTRLVGEAARVTPAADGDGPAGGELIRMCSWCSRIRLDDGGWMELPDAVARLGLFCGAEIAPISHGMCARCVAEMEGALDGRAPVRSE